MLTRHHRFVAAALVVLSVGVRARAQSHVLTNQSHVLSNEEIPFDNLRDRHLNFETSPIQPMTFSPDGSKLYAVNQPGSRLAILDPDTLARVFEVQIGLGAVTVVPRPGSDELWVVDSVDSCVSVIDPAANAIVRTIRVGAQPHGLAFTDNGDRAYVTCSGADRVDVIRTSIYRVVKSIPIPARNPRAIVFLNGKAYVASFLSGNNTAPMGSAGDVNGVVAVENVLRGGTNALPDRDLLVILAQAQPELDDLDPSATVTGLGTILFNLHVRPGTSELWIPNTEALNAAKKGEVNFVGGQVVSNRITIVDTSGATPPRIVDLDAIAPPDAKCGQPAYVAFDQNSTRAFVCGYGNDLVAVLRVGPGQAVTWEGSIQLPPKQAYPRGTGPRACCVDVVRRALYVFEKNDNSVTKVLLGSLPVTPVWQAIAPNAVTLGFDPTSDEERLGRHLFSNARFSASLTSSCASCHVDGHTDMLAWDLSHYLDPEGTPNSQLQYGTDVKGPLVTQSARRMAESGPFHWRGEKAHIDKFQGAFVDLLENTVAGVVQEIGPDFQYLRHYVDRLAYPPNPRESLDRCYTPAQLSGATLFMTRAVSGALTCSSCHQLPIGSGGEIVAQPVSGIPRSADVPQLRGVADKLSKPYAIGGLFGSRSELGAGLTHGGAIATLQDAMRGVPPAPLSHRFDLTAQEADLIADFLGALDTGVAPAAALQVTANAVNWSAVAAQHLQLLKQQAGLGNCDLVYYRTPRVVLGQFANLAGTYDTTTHKYQVASAGSPQIDEQVLLQEAAAGMPVTFLGVPCGMGRPMALDRDTDRLLDLDEIAHQTLPEEWDTDHDVFPDGYETAWGMDPLQPTGSSTDHQPPALLGPARLVYATTNSIKFEFDCTEFCRVNISYNGGYPVQRSPLGPHCDEKHWIVLNDLEPDTLYQIMLEMTDPAGNLTVDTSTLFRTRPRAAPTPACVTDIAATLLYGPGGSTTLRSVVILKVGAAAASAGYQVQAAVYYQPGSAPLALVADNVIVPTGSTGKATFQVPLPIVAGATQGAVWFVVKDVQAPAGAAPYVMGLNTMSTASLPY